MKERFIISNTYDGEIHYLELTPDQARLLRFLCDEHLFDNDVTIKDVDDLPYCEV